MVAAKVEFRCSLAFEQLLQPRSFLFTTPCNGAHITKLERATSPVRLATAACVPGPWDIGFLIAVWVGGCVAEPRVKQGTTTPRNARMLLV